MSLSEQSDVYDTPALRGEHTASGTGVQGISKNGQGVWGISETRIGVVGESQGYQGVFGKSRDNAGVVGESDRFHAVYGHSHGSNNAGVFGLNDAGGVGVSGISNSNIGVAGDSKTGFGVQGRSETGDGVFGIGARGVFGKSRDNVGVVGESDRMHAVFGITHSTFAGVFGTSDAGGTGVAGESITGIGIHGKGGKLAGYFEGDVEVTGDIRLTNADCAEDFDIAEADGVEPGTVMVLDNEGILQPSYQAYDKRVAGVISGAGGYKPGIILDKQLKSNRKPIALLGKVYCKVDARYGPIEIGDLLTTSDTPGHAMKASDPFKAFGTVIGKALKPLNEGQAYIPILVTLQ